MKNKILVFFSALMVVIAITFALNSVYNFIPLKGLSVDSGFDSSWDSGSDWGSSSSWDSGSDWGSSWNSSSSSSSSGSGTNQEYSPLMSFVNFLLFCAIFWYVFYRMSKINTSYDPLSQYKELTDEEIYEKLGADFNINEFKKEIFKIYKDVQIAWMNNDIESVRDVLSDTIFNMYKTQLLTLEAKHQKNMMEDIEYMDSYITNIVNTNSYKEIDVILGVTCKDYLITTKTNNVVRGNKNKINNYIYKLTFKCDEVDNKVYKCPSCGAELNDSNSTVCEHCHSIIVKKTSKWVLTQKKMIKQS